MEGRKQSFTGVRRQRKTSWRVRTADHVAKIMIGAGGAGTIIAVLTVSLFLVWVVFPLFLPARTTGTTRIDPPAGSERAPLHIATDDYLTSAWSFHRDRILRLFTLADGTLLQETRLFEDRPAITAASFSRQSSDVIIGFEDGSVQIGTIGFRMRFLNAEDDAEVAALELKEGETLPFRGGLVNRTPEGQLRLLTVSAEFDDPIAPASDSPVRLVDEVQRPNGPVFAVLHEDGTLLVNSVRRQKNLMTGKTTVRVKKGELPRHRHTEGEPAYLLVNGTGDNVYLAWDDGHLVRYDARDLDSPQLAEVRDLTDRGRALTAAKFLIGRSTIVAGDEDGALHAWFVTKPADATTTDGGVLVRAHELETAGGAAVTALDVSARSRAVAAGFADGTIHLYNVTSGKLLAEEKIDGPVEALAISPRDDGLLAFGESGATFYALDMRHPEVTMTALFLPVWYEGYVNPETVWQSSSGSDDFEPKFGLWPLVFGTLKATVYSMVFAIPLALLAAIFTSEYLSPRTRSRVKPAIEMMASLPSVVLGFLAGIVIAPFVENWIVTILCSFITVPVAILLGSYTWQLLPAVFTIRWDSWRAFFVGVTVPLGLLVALPLASIVEHILFAGDLKLWLDGQRGTATGGWIFLLIPFSAVIVFVTLTRTIDPWMRSETTEWSRRSVALLDMIKFVAALAATVLLSVVCAMLLSALGFDPRGNLIGTYVQRNALIVGFIMGFAVIPIIYTIAEDALSTVPNTLRSASLGAGATRWQTATRVVIPTAMSGLFSAIMVGLGRAVGETMIVLMAAGNTPLLDWNIFNGFRTLSANIAVELPEAVRDSTHYRTLFLAALVLFLMTFVINTLAEAVRLRFRKRAFEL